MIKLDKIGSDPEFGIVDSIGQPLPSFLFFDGTKKTPELMGNGFAVLKDNLLVEGNIPACATKEKFIDSMKFLKSLIEVPLKEEDLEILSEDLIEYNPIWINTPDGQEFGCSDFKSAYKRNNIRTPHLTTDIRQVGFHIHVSFDIIDKRFSRKKYANYLTKAMDYFVGIPSDQILYSKERRESYGALGSYRNTPYGFEYRSLGGYFTKDHYLEWVYDQTVKAIQFCSVLTNLEKLDKVTDPSIENYKLLNINLGAQVPVKQLV